MKNYCYEAKPEEFQNEGQTYISYGIFTKENGQITFIYHDVTTDQKEVGKLCGLLNKYDLEPEQAKYVVEDYMNEKYLVE